MASKMSSGGNQPAPLPTLTDPRPVVFKQADDARFARDIRDRPVARQDLSLKSLPQFRHHPVLRRLLQAWHVRQALSVHLHVAGDRFARSFGIDVLQAHDRLH